MPRSENHARRRAAIDELREILDMQTHDGFDQTDLLEAAVRHLRDVEAIAKRSMDRGTLNHVKLAKALGESETNTFDTLILRMKARLKDI